MQEHPMQTNPGNIANTKKDDPVAMPFGFHEEMMTFPGHEGQHFFHHHFHHHFFHFPFIFRPFNY